jgi:hypothetical protein
MEDGRWEMEDVIYAIEEHYRNAFRLVFPMSV